MSSERFNRTAHVFTLMAEDVQVLRKIRAFGEAILKTHREGGTVFAFGNGGSASEADHFVGELLGKFEDHRVPIRAHCLTNETAALTATANDDGYTEWPARLARWMTDRDLLVILSTSCMDHTGDGSNVIAAVRAARDIARTNGGHPTVVVVTGRRYIHSPLAEDPETFRYIPIILPTDRTSEVQEATLGVLHAVCAFVDEMLDEVDP